MPKITKQMAALLSAIVVGMSLLPLLPDGLRGILQLLLLNLSSRTSTYLSKHFHLREMHQAKTILLLRANHEQQQHNSAAPGGPALFFDTG